MKLCSIAVIGSLVAVALRKAYGYGATWLTSVALSAAAAIQSFLNRPHRCDCGEVR